MGSEQTVPVETVTESPLTKEEQQYCQELHSVRDMAVAQLNGALTLILRQRGLVGNWTLSPDATKLVKGE